MKKTDAAKATVWEGSSPINLARVVGYSNANITQSAVSSVRYMVTKVVSGTVTEVVASTPLTVADVVYDSLQTDAIWTEDSTGFNFKHQLAATDIPDGGTIYTVNYRLEDTNNNYFFVSFELTTKEQAFD